MDGKTVVIFLLLFLYGTEVMANIYNNPGNIEKGQAYAGQTGNIYGERFAEFDSPEMGLRAIFRDLRTKMKRYNGDVDKIISEFAPPNENVTSKYINRIKSAIGGDKLTNRNMKNAVKELVAIEAYDNQEIINYYLDNNKIIDAAEELSYIDMPSNTTGATAKKLYYEGEYPRKHGGRIMKDPNKNYKAQRFI